MLLGDPQQLAHVSQGTHAHGSGASVLEHLLAGEQTVPRDRGVFLGTSWRMHPAICDFISRAMYDRALRSVDGNEVLRIGLTGRPQRESGLRLLSCEHDDKPRPLPGGGRPDRARGGATARRWHRAAAWRRGPATTHP